MCSAARLAVVGCHRPQGGGGGEAATLASRAATASLESCDAVSAVSTPCATERRESRARTARAALGTRDVDEHRHQHDDEDHASQAQQRRSPPPVGTHAARRCPCPLPRRRTVRRRWIVERPTVIAEQIIKIVQVDDSLRPGRATTADLAHPVRATDRRTERSPTRREGQRRTALPRAATPSRSLAANLCDVVGGRRSAERQSGASPIGTSGAVTDP